MAQEASNVCLTGNPVGRPIKYTVLNGDNISGGTLLAISGSANRTATKTGAISGARFAGVATADKVAGDGATTIGVYTEGIFDMWTSDTIAEGESVSLSGSNYIRRGVTAGTNPFGIAMEAAAAGTAEQIQVAVGIYGVSD